MKKVSAIDQKCEAAEDHQTSTQLEEKPMKALKSDGINPIRTGLFESM